MTSCPMIIKEGSEECLFGQEFLPTSQRLKEIKSVLLNGSIPMEGSDLDKKLKKVKKTRLT